MEMDASGCWVRKNTQAIREIPLRSNSDYYSRLASSLDAKDTVDTDKQDGVFISW